MFVCKHCGVSVETLYAFINHAKGHKNTANFRFSCAVSECPCTFQSLSALQSHMYRKHTKSAKITNRSEQRDLSSRCSVEGCNVTFVSTKFCVYVCVFIYVCLGHNSSRCRDQAFTSYYSKVDHAW